MALGAGAVFAYGAIPASDGTITACFSPDGGGNVRFVDDSSQCRKGDPSGTPAESVVTFNQKGQTGATGPAGPAGAAGAAGAPGAPGAPGGGAPAPQAAASDYFLEIDGIKGESTDQKHKDTIEIYSFSWGLSQTGAHSSGGGGGAGKASFQDLHFTTKVNKSSPLLAKRAAQGEHIKKATLFVRKSGPAGGQGDYYVIKLQDILVSSYQSKPDPDAPGVPTDQVSFSYAKIEWSYRPQLSNGALGAPISAGYDLKANKKI